MFLFIFCHWHWHQHHVMQTAFLVALLHFLGQDVMVTLTMLTASCDVNTNPNDTA